MGQQIKPTEAKKLCDNFDAKFTALTALIKKDDNRSVQFSINELKGYFKYLESSEGEDINDVKVFLGNNKATYLTTVFFAPVNVEGEVNQVLDCYNLGVNGYPPSKKY